MDYTILKDLEILMWCPGDGSSSTQAGGYVGGEAGGYVGGGQAG